MSVREIAIPTEVIPEAPSTGGGTAVYSPSDDGQEETPADTEDED